MEELYHYLWKHRMFGCDFRDGNVSVNIVSPGRLNTNAGPDFSGAVVRIDGQQWVGNVEIHLRASDWYRHRHDTDPAYNNIILHVVGCDDRRVSRADGSIIPQIEVKIPDGTIRTHEELKSGLHDIRCRKYLSDLNPLVVQDWIETLAVERLQSKSQRIANYLEQVNGDWERAAFITIARALGFGVNSEPFEMLGRLLPLNHMRRHADNPLQLEAIVFGVAGVLQPHLHPYDEYYQTLLREYSFLAAKYGLRSMDSSQWKFSRMRPQSQPYRRMALLAAVVAGKESLTGMMTDYAAGKRETDDIFGWEVSRYWQTHYGFGTSPGPALRSLGKTAMELLLINAVVPFAYLFTARQGNLEGAEKCMGILEKIPPERNSIIETWKSLGIRAENAFRSQALIHLRREYCDKSECLHCRFGHKVLRRTLLNAE